MLRPTFMGFNTARTGLSASQKLLDVVGQNLTNVNTTGYTRQRVDLYAISSSSGMRMYPSKDALVGKGVEIGGVSQYRDSFLDKVYRDEASKAGVYAVENSALSDLESIFDEMTKEGIHNQISDLVDQLQELARNASTAELESSTRKSAETLCAIFNNYASRIDTVKDQQFEYLQSEAVTRVNDILKEIASLNKQIKTDNIAGNPSLELNDTRNMLLDELSQYVDINAKYTKEQIGPDTYVDVLSIDLRNSDGTKTTILDHVDYGSFAVDMYGDDAALSVTDVDGYTHDITDKIDKGQIAGYMNFINGGGSYKKIDVSGVNAKLKAIEYGDDIEKNRLELESDLGVTLTYADGELKMPDGTVLVDKNGAKNFVTHPNDDKIYLDNGSTVEDVTAKLSGNKLINKQVGNSSKGVQYYMGQIDMLANKLADVMNTANNTYEKMFVKEDDKFYYVHDDGERYEISESTGEKLIDLKDGTTIKIEVFEDKDNGYYILDNGNKKNWQEVNKPIFGSHDNGPINASNIIISPNWTSGTNSYITNRQPSFVGESEKSMVDWDEYDKAMEAGGANENINQMIYELSTRKHKFYIGNELMYEGTFQSAYANIAVDLNSEVKSTELLFQTHMSTLDSTELSREALSGVSLDEEGISMLTYSKSYNAAARLMTTLDEMLDTLINRMAV